MKSDVRKILGWMIVVVGFAVVATPSLATAQDNFREFDRRMVATPAELFEALSTLQPSEQRKQLEAQRQRKIEEAGREFLSKLTPEEKEKAFEFAEKYLRKNGVDATSSQKLMEQFGLPIEMQKELSEQFRKYGNGNQQSESGSPQNDAREDEIGQLLRKARDKFSSGSPDKTPDGKGPGPGNPGDSPKPDSGRGQDGNANSGFDSDPKLPKQDGDKSGQKSSKDPGQANPQLKPVTPGDQSTQNANEKRTDRNGNPNGTSKPLVPQSNDGAANQNRNRQFPRLNRNRRKPGDTDNVATEADLDRLLGQLEGRKKNAQINRRSKTDPAGSDPSSTGDLDWEKVIKDLAEKGRTDASGSKAVTRAAEGVLDAAELQRAKKLLEQMSGNDSIDPDKLKRAKDVVSRSIESRKKSGSNGRGGLTSKDSNSNERAGTRFDRLLVKAAQRTLSSDKDGDPSVSKSVGSMFGDLIERVQKQTTEKKEKRKRFANRSSGNRDRQSNKNESSGNQNRSASQAGNSNDISGSNSGSQPSNPFQRSSSTPDNTSLDPGKILDSLPDFSGVNPTHVFTFFAIVGLLFFVGYLLAQSFVGNETKIKQRKVIQQIRETKLKSPKDLIETVDVFLLAKFGIKSSWWNAGVVHNVLASSSPELKSRVDELIQDYIRARYMRADIQISSADQQRYRKTLEELSLIDIKPARKLELVSTSLALSSAASAEG